MLMEVEDLPTVFPASPASPQSLSVQPALPTPVRRAIRERPSRVVPSLSTVPALPSPIKRDIRAGRRLKTTQNELQLESEVEAVKEKEEEVEEQGSAFPSSGLSYSHMRVTSLHVTPCPPN